MTNEQKQCLLRYLGYYQGDISDSWDKQATLATAGFQSDYGLDPDGIFGPLTEDAAKKAVAGLIQPVEPEDPLAFWDNVKYFKPEEFHCKCGGKHCDGSPAQMDPLLLTLADRVREHFGAAAIVSSGLRCPVHNKNVGGAAASRHMSGKAMDFRIKGKGSGAVLSFVQKQPEVRYAYAIDGSYVHMDVK